MAKKCNHNFAQAWFYRNMNSKRYQCLNCGKIVNSKTFVRWYLKKLEEVRERGAKK